MVKIDANKATNASTDALNKSEKLFVNNKKIIISAVIAIIVIVVGVIGYNNFIAKPRAEKAATALANAQELFMMQDYQKALNGQSAAQPGFIQIISDYGSTESGNLANYYAGLCYAKMNKWNEAVKYLEEFSPQKDAFVSPMSQMALGDAYANLKQNDKAVEAFKKAASMADKAMECGINNTISPLALQKAGIILVETGKKEDALNIFKSIKETYVNSPISMEIDKYIELATK